jgi:uncharacterized protein
VPLVWPSLLEALLLVGAGVITGWVNTLAGAGGLVAIPVLLLSGLSAQVANGTLRVAIIAQSLIGAASFRHAQRLPARPLITILPVVVLGGAMGSLAAVRLPGDILEPVILVVLVVMALGLLVRASWFLPAADETPRPMTAFSGLALLACGFYGGFVQAGVGLLLIAVLSGVMRFDVVRGNAIKLAVTLTFNCVSLAIFALANQVEWRRAALLSAGSAVGAVLAVRFAIRRGQQAIRWVLIVAVGIAVAAIIVRSS